MTTAKQKTKVMTLKFNAFGLVTIQRRKLTATLTLVADGRSITRTISSEEITIEDINDGESIVVTLGAWIEKGKSRITAHEIGTDKYEYLMAEIPQVKDVINRTVNLIKNAAELE